ncbi:MAG: hypothetical protein QNL62_01535 [Gammaproteobacteria bacterium]|nr:hypothetical protein [Gammaproteobacteria bacterium]
MNSIETVREFLGWCSVINVGMLLISTLMLTVMRGWIVNIHASMTGVSKTELPRIYLEFLGNYKMLIIVLNLVPYIALRIMA